jgi:hypothetical protein
MGHALTSNCTEELICVRTEHTVVASTIADFLKRFWVVRARYGSGYPVMLFEINVPQVEAVLPANFIL